MNNPGQVLLRDWCCVNDATIGDLLRILEHQALSRDDVIFDIRSRMVGIQDDSH